MDIVRSAVQRARESLFVVPAVIVAFALALGFLSVFLDHHVDAIDTSALLLSVSIPGSRAIAGAVAGATITVAAIVFSITALSSQIAATQYSPRAVAGFFEDRFQQLVIGMVVGTFCFALTVLGGLGGDDTPQALSTGSLSATLTLVSGIVSVLAILAYLDHSLRRMRIAAVVRRIAETSIDAVHRQRRRSRGENGLDEPIHLEGAAVQVHAAKTGWVRDIDAARLAHSLPAGSVARVEVRVGEAVSRGDLLATVWDPSGSPAADVLRRVERAIHVGRDRSVDRDPAYGIRQLIDIGLRALSPGVNDPTTAIDVLQHVKAPVREILLLDPPARVYAGAEQQRVFLTEAPSRSDSVHAAFGEIRLASNRQPAVLHTLIETLSDLIGDLESAGLEARSTALHEEVALAVEEARSSSFPEADLERVLTAAKRIGLADGAK